MPSPLTLPRPVYLVPLVLASGALFQLAAFWRGIGRARAFAAQGRRYERRSTGAGPAILILGDSTGVGVGASTPEESLAGLLATDFPEADIVNVSVSGSRACDTLAQAEACVAEGRRYDIALVHLGGNDIVRATPPGELAAACDALLTLLPAVASRTVWLGPPNVGLAPLFPRPYGWVLAARSRMTARVIAAAAAKHGATFVDFCAPEHDRRFGVKRAQHFASDGFHPNSSSYRYGYTTARAAMKLEPAAARVRPAEAADASIAAGTFPRIGPLVTGLK